MVYTLPHEEESNIRARAELARAARDQAAANGAPALVEHAIAEPRPVRVVVIGAGFSGVGAAVYLPQKIDKLDLVVYERAEEIGGVWNNNRYMGAACDIPAHTYQYSFCDNSQWSQFYAAQPEIKKYISRVVDEYGVREYIKTRHTVTSLRWDARASKWNVGVDGPNGSFSDTADFVYYGPGMLSNPRWPAIPGREKYKGIIHHSGSWDAAAEEAAGMDWSNKRVGVIGVGSSAIQIVPEMQKKCKSLISFARSKTWITQTFGENILKEIGADTSKSSNYNFTDKEKEDLKNPEAYRAFRLKIERDLGSAHYVTHRDSGLQTFVRGDAEARMRSKLASRPGIADALVPNFTIGCKRLTPGPGYLDALTEDNVQFCTEELFEFTEKGLRTASGEIELDAIICATGYVNSSVPRFPIIGTDGVNLQDAWKDEARTYLAVSVPSMPNFFSILGPQSYVGSGNLLIVAEAQMRYVAAAINKCQTEGYSSLVVKEQQVADFIKYTDDYFARTVFTNDCNSWYKAGSTAGNIRTLWPGSSQHQLVALRHPRWEDYTFTRGPEYKHTMAWLGDGHIPASYDPAFFYDEFRAEHKGHRFLVD